MKSNTEICKKLLRLFFNETMFLLGKRVYDVCDHKLRSNTRTNIATLTKDECLHTCQNRDITGCESRTNRKFNTECFFHTKYIVRTLLDHEGGYCLKMAKGIPNRNDNNE